MKPCYILSTTLIVSTSQLHHRVDPRGVRLVNQKALQALLPPASATENFPSRPEHPLPHQDPQREKSQFQSRRETTFWWLFGLPPKEKSSPTATVIWIEKNTLLKILNHPDYFSLPSMPDAEVKPEQMEERMKHLENYLESMLRIKVFRNHSETVTT